MKNNFIKKAFTIIELVIVIAIIAVLSAVSVITYFGVINSSNEEKLKVDAKAFHNALLSQLITNDYIDSEKKVQLSKTFKEYNDKKVDVIHFDLLSKYDLDSESYLFNQYTDLCRAIKEAGLLNLDGNLNNIENFRYDIYIDQFEEETYEVEYYTFYDNNLAAFVHVYMDGTFSEVTFIEKTINFNNDFYKVYYLLNKAIKYKQALISFNSNMSNASSVNTNDFVYFADRLDTSGTYIPIDQSIAKKIDQAYIQVEKVRYSNNLLDMYPTNNKVYSEKTLENNVNLNEFTIFNSEFENTNKLGIKSYDNNYNLDDLFLCSNILFYLLNIYNENITHWEIEVNSQNIEYIDSNQSNENNLKLNMTLYYLNNLKNKVVYIYDKDGEQIYETLIEVNFDCFDMNKYETITYSEYEIKIHPYIKGFYYNDPVFLDYKVFINFSDIDYENPNDYSGIRLVNREF